MESITKVKNYAEVVSACIICEKSFMVRDKDGFEYYQNNNLGMCSSCFNTLKQLITEKSVSNKAHEE